APGPGSPGPATRCRPPSRSLGGLRGLELLPGPGDLEELLDPLGRSGALAESLDGLVVVHLDGGRLATRVVGADLRGVPAVARRAGVGGDDAVGRLLLLAAAREEKSYGHGQCLPSSFSPGLRSGPGRAASHDGRRRTGAASRLNRRGGRRAAHRRAAAPPSPPARAGRTPSSAPSRRPWA